jgi:signal transduction histidine kinase
MAELIVLTGVMRGKSYPLSGREVLIGRHSQDISLPDDMVSRRHARVAPDGDTYTVEDLGSRNGTFVNDARVDRRPLRHGDKIMIGGNLIEFRAGGEPAAPAPAPGPDTTGAMHRTITLDASERDVLRSDSDEMDIRALQRARADLAAIYQAGQVITSTLNVAQIYARLLDIVFKELPHADVVSIHVLEGPGGALACKGHRERGNPAATGPVVFSSSMSQFVMRERKAMLTFDAMTDGHFNATDSIAAFHIRSAMCAPLLSGDRLLGVLQANTLDPAHKFDRDDLRLLTAFGLQAGAALDNSLLYERLAADKAELQDAHEKLKLAQESLIHSEKLAAVGRLAAGIVHDIKNPLTVILSHAEMLEMFLKKAGIQKAGDLDILESLAEIQKGVLHCNEVVTQLLHFARQTKPSAALLDINELLQTTVSFVSHELKKSKVTAQLELAEELPPVMADAGQLKQVFLNIIINAIQAIESEPGRITITTKTAGRKNRETVEIRIKDNGAGMTDEVRQRLFEPFFTTKQPCGGLGGTGLGLAISYGIIQNHGGSIQVTSQPGKGSTFVISLPPAPAAGQPA